MPSVPELIRRSNRRIQRDLDNSLAQTARSVDRTNRAVVRHNAVLGDQFQDSLARTARVIDRTNGQIDKTFEPVKTGFDKAFSKANMESFDDGLVHVLKETGNILGQVTSVGDKVLNNPVTQLLGGVPILGEAIGAARLINTGLKAGGAVSTGVSGLADRRNYDKQNGAQVTGNVLERTANTATDVAGSGIRFH
jgi:hypothetical protein